MSNIKIGISQLPEPSKSIGTILIDFYEQMKALENDSKRGGKQATLILMTMTDLEKIIIDNCNSFKNQENNNLKKNNKMEHNIKTYNDLLEALKTLSPEQLNQDCSVLICDDSLAKKVDSISCITEDIYVNKSDNEDMGSLSDLEQLHLEDFDKDDYKLCTPAGRIFIYSN